VVWSWAVLLYVYVWLSLEFEVGGILIVLFSKAQSSPRGSKVFNRSWIDWDFHQRVSCALSSSTFMSEQGDSNVIGDSLFYGQEEWISGGGKWRPD